MVETEVDLGALLEGAYARPCRPWDITEMAPHMRPADRAEITAQGVSDPVRALTMSVRSSLVSWTAVVDEGIACMFGVAPRSIASGEGIPWMLGTNLVRKHARAFLKAAPLFVNEMHRYFPVLANVVDSRNKEAVRWLRFAGFTLRDKIPYGPEGILFHPFDKEV